MIPKVIIDTNIWISYLITNNFLALDDLIINKKIDLVFSFALIDEFIAVANRPKLKKYFPETEFNRLLSLILHFGQIIEVVSKVSICRDNNDDFLLSLAKDSNADFLITGDNDLLVLEYFHKTRIVSYTDFQNEFKNFTG